jgi:hypothetical protein
MKKELRRERNKAGKKEVKKESWKDEENYGNKDTNKAVP